MAGGALLDYREGNNHQSAGCGDVSTKASSGACYQTRPETNDGGEQGLDSGIPRMTPETLKECAVQNQGFTTPELNEVLILHFKGFRKIENLTAYSQVRSLFLECNGISRIENLDSMPHLVSLYLQNNCIKRIEGLDALTDLKSLNLSHNSISKVENLASLKSLEVLNLQANKILDMESLQGLAERPTLKSVDISANYIEDGEGLMTFWAKNLPEVDVLYLHRQPCSRTLKDYRRRIISSLKNLKWLDERRIFDWERVGCEAWAQGGKEAEAAAKLTFINHEKEEKERSFQNFRRMQEAAAQRGQRQMEARSDAVRKEVAAEFDQSGHLADGWCTVPARPKEQSTKTDLVPTRRAEFRAKVDEFLRKQQAQPSETESMEDPATDGTKPTALQEEKGKAVCAQDVPCPAECTNESEGKAEMLDSASVNSVDNICVGPESAKDEKIAVEEGFMWSSFKDKRLGRLVAEHRYDFKKAAAAFNVEFEVEVDIEQCRQRYRELTRPRLGVSVARDDARRACDVEADPVALRDASAWWLRKLCSGVPRDSTDGLKKASLPSVTSQVGRSKDSILNFEPSTRVARDGMCKSESSPPSSCPTKVPYWQKEAMGHDLPSSSYSNNVPCWQNQTIPDSACQNEQSVLNGLGTDGAEESREGTNHVAKLAECAVSAACAAHTVQNELLELD